MVPDPPYLDHFRHHRPQGAGNLFYPPLSLLGRGHRRKRKGLDRPRAKLPPSLSGSGGSVLPSGRQALEKVLEHPLGQGPAVFAILGVRVPDRERTARPLPIWQFLTDCLHFDRLLYHMIHARNGQGGTK